MPFIVKMPPYTCPNHPERSLCREWRNDGTLHLWCGACNYEDAISPWMPEA